MTSILQDSKIEFKTYPVQLQDQGQITVPRGMLDDLGLTEGDTLVLFQIGDLVLLTPKQPQVPLLADKIVAIMEDENVSLADLLAGLQEERKTIQRERKTDA